ncbi:MAG: DNA repair protein RadC [bacterium]
MAKIKDLPKICPEQRRGVERPSLPRSNTRYLLRGEKLNKENFMTKSFTIHDLPKEERPRERLVKFGEQALSAQELLQLILGRGVVGESVAVMAQKLLTQFGSLQKLSEASIEELSSIKGIGLAKAAQIKAVFEISRRFSTQTLPYKSKELTDPKKVCKLIKSKLKDYSKEHFYLIALNTRNWSINEISIGTLNANLVHPREVFAQAIKNKAASVILAHNHPSGDPEPSEDDLEITKRLTEAGKILGIEVVDHIIITKSDFLSFKEKGLI